MRHFKRRAAQHHRWRPYRIEYTGSLLTSEVKLPRAWLVLGWGTAWEHLQVLSAMVLRAAAKRRSHFGSRYKLGCCGIASLCLVRSARALRGAIRHH